MKGHIGGMERAVYPFSVFLIQIISTGQLNPIHQMDNLSPIKTGVCNHLPSRQQFINNHDADWTVISNGINRNTNIDTVIFLTALV